MKTTLNKIKARSPCASVWEKLIKNLGKIKADNEPLLLTTILESNGLDDALWSLRAVYGKEREMRLFAVMCARSVQHLMTDKCSLDALDVAERYANGLATQADLAAAWAAAWNAARDVAWDDAADAARAAAWDDAGDAALAAASDAAWAAAAEDVAWDVAWTAVEVAAADAARAAARAAARDVQAILFILMCEGAL